MLIIFTNYYPYFKGEEYMETEILELSKAFDKIFVFPTLLSKKMELTRKVPDNVKVFPVYYENTIVDKVTSMVKSFLLSNSDTRKIINDDTKILKEKMYDYYFEGRINKCYDSVKNYLNSEGIASGEDVILYSYWIHAAARIAIKVKKEYFNDRVKKIFTRAHGYDINVQVSQINFLPEREFLFENLETVYCVSSLKAQELMKDYPKYKDKFKTARLGTNRQVDIPIAEKNKFTIVTCSSLKKVKRIDKIVDSLALFNDLKQYDITWVHLGGAGEQLNKLKEEAKSKITNVKTVFYGHIDNANLLEWYKSNKPSVFLNASESEGVPVSIMEAMSFGLPIIATDVGGTREIVFDQSNGLLLDKNVSPEEIRDALIKVYNMNEDEYKEMSNKSIEIWADKVDAQKNYKEFIDMMK